MPLGNTNEARVTLKNIEAAGKVTEKDIMIKVQGKDCSSVDVKGWPNAKAKLPLVIPDEEDKALKKTFPDTYPDIPS